MHTQREMIDLDDSLSRRKARIAPRVQVQSLLAAYQPLKGKNIIFKTVYVTMYKPFKQKIKYDGEINQRKEEGRKGVQFE